MKRFFSRIEFWVGVTILFILMGMIFSNPFGTMAAIEYNVTSTSREDWAWNDFLGWVDFNYSDYVIPCSGGQNGSVCVSSIEIRGRASSSLGPVYLDCNSHPTGCTGHTYGVANNGHGALSNYAWNNVIGWIGFYDATLPFRTLIEARVPGSEMPPSDFEQWAWNPVVGWISFNCEQLDGILGSDYCGSSTSSFKVSTDWYATSTQGWLESATFDTGLDDGAQFNSISWRGDLPIGTEVKFYFSASSTPNGPWNFKGPYKSNTTSQDQDNKLFSARLGFNEDFNGKRYFRYKIVLVSNTSQTLSPIVEDVAVNWSP